MSYQVTAPLVLAKDRTGKVRYHYYDSVIPWLSSEQAAHLLDLDMVVEIPDVEEFVDPNLVVSDESEPDGLKMPNRVAPKDEWSAYAVAITAKTDKPLTNDEAEAFTKVELIERFG